MAAALAGSGESETLRRRLAFCEVPHLRRHRQTQKIMSNTLKLPCPVGQVSDGYHTFDELYDHRCLLFIALMRAHHDVAWATRAHHNGEVWAGWFIAGLKLPTGKTITYHLPEKFWWAVETFPCAKPERAPQWDGHTSKDVIGRLMEWL